MDNDGADLRQVLAGRINRLLKLRGLSIEKASIEAELEYSNFYYITKGKKMPRVDTLLKIARGLNVPPEYFLRDMPLKIGRQPKPKDNLLLNKILGELNRLDQSAKTFLLKTLKLYNRQKQPALRLKRRG
ncbi:MAG: helix-turn-helix domain-containing protein [Candidatus Margulisbacteria bacterium]|jgi:transcriptional regulator with XRE-family HTH domain|nr:helix-turn-helix domain-containing protein [Candidatus Margulisiibacteriota bacterium]